MCYRTGVSWEVWFYQSVRGGSPIEDFLNDLPAKAKAKCIAYMEALEEHGFELPRSFIAKVRGHIWELCPEWAGTEYRFFYVAMVGRRFVILHALKKKSQKVKGKDLELAEVRYAEVTERWSDEATPPIRPRTECKGV
jgi:phage-related protein